MDPLTEQTFSLSRLVRLFSISFRLKSAYGGFEREGPEAGCEVELIGRHGGSRKHIIVDKCPRCLELVVLLLEIQDCILSGGGSGRHFRAQCRKLIRYASTPGDQHEAVVDVRITRLPTLQPVPANWLVTLSEEIRAELEDLGCREVSFMPLPASSLNDQVLVRR